VLCPDLTSEDELTEVVERILTLLIEPMHVEGREVALSGSVGVAVVRAETPRATSLTDLLREADAAMYRAKANGRNRWERMPVEPPPELRPRYAAVRPAQRDPALTDS
jgi:diguanylate cyclase (GGDEF)-like protein